MKGRSSEPSGAVDARATRAQSRDVHAPELPCLLCPRVRRPWMRVNAVLVLAVVLVLGACSSTSKTGQPETRHNPSHPTDALVGGGPSSATKMICEKEARSEIAGSLGVHETRVTTPTWTSHIYSCTYVYRKGSVTLSVTELINMQDTTAYFRGLSNRLGRAEVLYGLSQGAFIAKNDDVVVHNDHKVLLVDVQGTPAPRTRDSPTMTRSDVATNVAAVIVGCWGEGGGSGLIG